MSTMYLILFDVLNSKVEPEPIAGPAGVRPHEQVVLDLGDVVCAAQVPALEGRVEAELTALRLATLPRRPHDQPAQIA